MLSLVCVIPNPQAVCSLLTLGKVSSVERKPKQNFSSGEGNSAVILDVDMFIILRSYFVSKAGDRPPHLHPMLAHSWVWTHSLLYSCGPKGRGVQCEGLATRGPMA